METELGSGHLGTARRKGRQQTNQTYCHRATSRLYRTQLVRSPSASSKLSWRTPVWPIDTRKRGLDEPVQAKTSRPRFRDGLVSKVSNDIYGRWSEIQSAIAEASNAITQVKNVKLAESCAPFFIVASIVADLHAAKHARGVDTFNALQRHVVNRLETALGRDIAKDLFDIYQTAWDEALDLDENPASFGLADSLYDFLKFPRRGGIPDSMLILVLADAILLPIGFTGFALEQYRVKP